MSTLPRYAPMLAQAGTLPIDGPDWTAEIKFDGIRAIAIIDSGVQLLSRNGKNITAAWPELNGLAPSTPGFVIDGEIVAFDSEGRSSFEALQPRMHQRDPDAVRALADTVPATYLIFDLLHIGDRPLLELPYTRRRELLERLDFAGPHWRIAPRLPGDAAAALEHSRRLGLEGIVCKRSDGRYLPGRRSPLWTKIKNVLDQEIVIVGWRPGTGRRTGGIGSLLMAVHDAAGSLTYIGNVGTGFTQRALDELRAELQPLQRDTPAIRADVPGAVWLEPRIVGEVSFAGWTGDGRLRHPSWRGLRPDRTPGEVVRQ